MQGYEQKVFFKFKKSISLELGLKRSQKEFSSLRKPISFRLGAKPKEFFKIIH